MGSRQHGQGRPAARHGFELCGQLGHGRLHYAGASIAQAQGIGQIVDVFGRTAEVDKGVQSLQVRRAREALTKEIFNRFNVVIGGRFKRLYPGRIGDAKVIYQCIDEILGGTG